MVAGPQQTYSAVYNRLFVSAPLRRLPHLPPSLLLLLPMLLSSTFTHASSWTTRRTGLASSLSFSPTRARVLSGPGQGGPCPLPWSVRSLSARRPSSFLLPFSQGEGAHEDVGVGRNGRGEARRTLCPSWAIRARSRVHASRDIDGHGGGKEERREGGKEGGKVGMEPGANGQHQQAEFLNDFLGLPAEFIAVAPPPPESHDAPSIHPIVPSSTAPLAPAPLEGLKEGAWEVGGEVDPHVWQTVDSEPPTMERKMFDATPFVEMFRNCAPYISMHRGAVMVLHLPGDLLGTPAFERTLDDASLMSLLGVKIVIVCGIAYQVDRRLRDVDTAPKYCGDVRITDADTLRIVKEEAGFARCEVESILSRGFKGRPGAMGINVVGGNFFYSAKPYGVIDGIDFGYTGEVRKIEAENIVKRLDQGDLVLLSTLGYSASGQTFNVVSEHLASETAAALQANKLIFITEGQTLVDTRTGHVIQSMRLKDAKALLEHREIVLYPQSVTDGCMVDGKAVLRESRPSDHDYQAAILRFTRYSVQALLKGVRRAHLVTPGNGRLLQEIFTRDGAGTLISRDLYDGIRPAAVADVTGIIDIIEPLMQDGILTRRSRKELEHDIGQYYVFTRDGLTVACGQLRRFGDCAEIGCLAVHPAYRKGGRGDSMLSYLERIAVNTGLSTIFVLSTRTMQWFLERGFEERSVGALPESRRDIYNWERKSKIYMKDIKTVRDLDAEELFYNV